MRSVNGDAGDGAGVRAGDAAASDSAGLRAGAAGDGARLRAQQMWLMQAVTAPHAELPAEGARRRSTPRES